jgi:hypothetical protein
MSEKATEFKPRQISAAQLLFVDPNAYVNLCLMFTFGPDPANPQPLTLDPEKHQLHLITPHHAVLLSKSPPAVMAFDQDELAWKQVQTSKDVG